MTVISLANRLKNDEMLWHGSVMIFFSVATGAFNYLYQLLMGIMLDTDQYGILYSLISLLTIITVFSQVIQTALAKFSSSFQAQQMMGKAAFLWRRTMKWTLLAGVALFVVLSALSPLISSYLKIDNYGYAVIIFASLIFSFAMPANQGMLQGMQKFIPLGFNGTLSTFIKLFFAGLLVYLGYGVYGGLIPHFLSSVIIFLVSLYFLRGMTKIEPEPHRLNSIFQYAGLSLLAIVAFMILTNIDAIFVKHYLTPEATGNYAAVAVLGKLALFLPAGIAIAMFPKTSSLSEVGGQHWKMMFKALLFTIVISGVLVIIYWLFAEPITQFLFRGKYLSAAPFVFKYGAAMALFSLAFLVMNYMLSLNQTKIAYSLLGGVCVQLLLIFLFHDNIEQVVDMVLISSIATLIFLLPFFRGLAGGDKQKPAMNRA